MAEASNFEEIPEFVLPPEMEAPTWTPPVLKVPSWCPPCEPGPIGFMRGTAPVLILDVSGTMNPRQRGKFPTMIECACELLHPQGELATAAGAFDVINFCNAAWAWSATYSQRLSLLASAQVRAPCWLLAGQGEACGFAQGDVTQAAAPPCHLAARRCSTRAGRSAARSALGPLLVSA